MKRGIGMALALILGVGCGEESTSSDSQTSTNGDTNSGGQVVGDAGAAGAPNNGGDNQGGSNSTAGTDAGGGSSANAGSGGQDSPPLDPDSATVVLFIIDGLQDDAARTAAANGADNIQFVIDNGVTVDSAYSVTPAPRLELPDGSLPWGNTTAPNVAIHTGCHVYDSRQMDDIFLAAAEKGIVSVYAGGDSNYGAFDTADFHYASSNYSDDEIVQFGIDHFTEDGTRLIRLHLQRIRDDWSGPAGKTDPNSAYVQAIIHADELMGDLIQTLKDGGAWDNTYLIVSSDHGMGQSTGSQHPASTGSSWEIFMGFYGPGLKQGATIPYAESPDMAIFTAHVLGLDPLQGHTDPAVTIMPKTPTGTLLTNLFEGNPDDLEHPRMVYRYLESENFAPSAEFVEYRAAMLDMMQDL